MFQLSQVFLCLFFFWVSGACVILFLCFPLSVPVLTQLNSRRRQQRLVPNPSHHSPIILVASETTGNALLRTTVGAIEAGLLPIGPPLPITPSRFQAPRPGTAPDGGPFGRTASTGTTRWRVLGSLARACV